jgi:hypothetical protein
MAGKASLARPARTEYETLTKHDALGRPVLTRVSPFSFMQVLVRGGLALNEVPDNHWAKEFIDGGDCARVKCACGCEPVVHIAAMPTKCECGRWFFFDATGVYSMCKPGQRADAPEEPAPA